MLTKFIDTIIVFASRSTKKKMLIKGAIFLLIASPLLAVTFYSYLKIKRDFTAGILARRETIAHLASAITEEKLTRLTDIGISLATRVRFRKLIEEGKWEEAVHILDSVPQDFSFIDGSFLIDTQGILMASTPKLFGTVGTSFVSQDWYRKVSSEKKSYISEAYRRIAKPEYTTIAVATPIFKDALPGEEKKMLGIMVLQVRLDTFFQWTKEVALGSSGFVYFVDQKAHVIAHPKVASQETLVDYADVPVIQKVLKGERGVEILYNPREQENQLVSYYPLTMHYGWGAIVQESVHTAFAVRDAHLKFNAILYGGIALSYLFLAYLMVRISDTLLIYRLKEKTFLESIGDGFIAIDREWNIIAWNKAASIITGWSRKEALGKPFRDIVSFLREYDRSENVVFIEDAIITGKTEAMEGKTIVVRKDGRELPVGDSASPIFDASGKVIGAIIIFRDLSKEQAAQMLRSDFAYASHQLRTPVNKALWGLETVLKIKPDDPKMLQETIRVTYLSILAVQKLVNELVEVSEIDQGVVIPKKTLIKLSEIIDEALGKIHTEAQARSITISAAPISATMAINTDPKLLKRVLLEVLENALYYNTEKGQISISVAVQENGILLEIKDTGIGIPKEQHATVFTKFFRGSNFDTTTIIGAGLGLYISRAYVRLLGGKMWFVSEDEKEKGTTVSIFLPTAEK